MLDTAPAGQADLSSYPREGVRISINHHAQTIGNHRIRLSIPRDIAKVLSRGLHYPRLHVEGTAASGLRLWCGLEGGASPTISGNLGTWVTTMPARRIKAREMAVPSTDLDVTWEIDDTGPVLLVPRLPDAFVPEHILDRLPNSQVDPETRFERADKRLAREIANLYADAPTVEDEPPPPDQPEPTPEPETPPVEPPSPPAVDLKEALQMVNELVDQLGDSVVLTIDPHGHVQAKRRVVQFIDL